MRVRPTEVGWKGLLLLAALCLAFFATAYSNLFFLTLVFCCALGGLGLVHGISNVRGVAVTRLELPLAAAGEAREVLLDVQARARRCDITVELLTADGAFVVADAPVVAGPGALQAALAARPRGVSPVHAVRVSSRFPFGFFAISRTQPAAATIVTHPDPRPARNRPEHERRDAGAARARNLHGTSVAGVRPFRTGDALADVHWRATARRGSPIVKEREPEAERTCTVVLDRRCAVEPLEAALSVAADLVLGARAADRTVRLLSQDAAFTVGHDFGDEQEALRWLAAATELPPSAPAAPPVAGALLLPHGAGARP